MKENFDKENKKEPSGFPPGRDSENSASDRKRKRSEGKATDSGKDSDGKRRTGKRALENISATLRKRTKKALEKTLPRMLSEAPCKRKKRILTLS